MHCTHCRSSMDQTDRVVEGRAQQTWYQCPLCGAEQTVSQPYEAKVRRIGNAQRCSCGWPEDLRLHRLAL